MSILIKALKQAERDHLARSAAGAPETGAAATVEADPITVTAPPHAPAARGGESLNLTLVETAEHTDTGADAAAGSEPAQPGANDARNDAAAAAATGDAADHGLSMDYELPPSADANSGKPPTPTAPAPASAFARPLAAILQTTDQGITGPRAPAPEVANLVANLAANAAAHLAPTTARAAGETQARGTPVKTAEAPSTTTPAARTPDPVTAAPAPASAASDPLQAEQRKAARQLMGAAPARATKRRIAGVLAVTLLVLGAAGAAYWQGLFTGLDGFGQGVQSPTPARPLADRLSLPPASPGDKAAKPHPRVAIAAAAAGSTVQSESKAQDGRTSGEGTALPARPTPAPPADGIHLRPPEATPERIRALLQDAYAASQRGDTAAATRIYQQVVELDHNNGDAWIGLAALAANSGDSAGANRAYRRALEIDPSDSIALGGLLGLQTNVDPQEAETRLRLLIVHDGAQPALLAALGKMIARQGRWLEAQETFFKAWTADPTQPDVAFNLAVSLERIRQPLPALSFYRRALELAQDHTRHFDPAVAQERVAALTPKQP